MGNKLVSMFWIFYGIIIDERIKEWTKESVGVYYIKTSRIHGLKSSFKAVFHSEHTLGNTLN